MVDVVIELTVVLVVRAVVECVMVEEVDVFVELDRVLEVVGREREVVVVVAELSLESSLLLSSSEDVASESLSGKELSTGTVLTVVGRSVAGAMMSEWRKMRLETNCLQQKTCL